MSISKKISMLSIALLTSLFLQACDDGPMENAGEELDNAAQETANRLEDACEDLTEENC